MAIDQATIGLRIKKRREELGKKQNEFADEIKIDSASLSRYERGVQNPTLETIIRIADGLEVSLDYLVYGNGTSPIINTVNHGESFVKRNLRYFISLIDCGFLSVSSLSSEQLLSADIIDNKEAYEFVKEVNNFVKCKDRLTSKAYKDGIEHIIDDYENRIIGQESLLKECVENEDFEEVRNNERKCESLKNEIKLENIK